MFGFITKLCWGICHPCYCFERIRYRCIFRYYIFAIYHTIIIPCVIWRKKNKKTTNVLFLAMNPDMWKYGGIFRRMSKDSRFHPIVVGAMRSNAPLDIQILEQQQMAKYFQENGIEFIDGYDEKKQKWVDLQSLHPDIIFYTQPYAGVIFHKFEFFYHLNALFCYTPYYFQHSKEAWNWNNPLQNYCWRQYYANQYQLQMCRDLSKIKGTNAVAVGYPLEEEIREIDKDKELRNKVWHNDKRRRIIWAPHHSIMKEELFKVSSFLEIYHEMVTLREKYKDKVIIAFKPHPMLKSKLYEIWGKETTDSYYDNWANSENSFYAPGDYKALFCGSDAMIHCCGSFLVEYHYTEKPVQYVYSKSRNPQDLGEVSDLALAAHYPAHSVEDIDKFIQQVVINGNDPMRKERQDFVDKYLKSPNGKMFSENVVDDILRGLGKA